MKGCVSLKRIISLFLFALCLLITVSAKNVEYTKIKKQDYYDKTLSGFLSQIAAMISGYEFKTDGDRYAVAMPDEWFEFCNGPYAGNAAHLKHTDKHIKNAESGVFEVWIDDDFGVDIFNQYILEDMFKDYGHINSRAVSDGWLKYGIWDMGGGQRQVGAYGIINRQYYLPQFAGNGEFGNYYSYLSEPYLAADTIGMNAGAMPKTAMDISETFATVTGDRDNVEWAKMFAAMLAMAYTESDIPTLIKEAAKVFPKNSYSASLIDEVFALHQKHPTSWRNAFIEFEKNHYTEGVTTGANTTINCGFAILTLLYGNGDYMETAKIGSLAGYDCESSCGIALAVLGIIGGTDVLPADVNALIWQNGKGVIVNSSAKGIPQGEYMHADNLDERILISDIVDKYIKNFEAVLTQNGGYADSDYYYIPKETLPEYKVIEIQNGGFENGSTSGFIATKKAVVTPITAFGKYGAKLTEDGELYTTVNGLTVGKTYALTAFIHATSPSKAYLFARDTKGGVATSVCSEGAAQNPAYKLIKRTLVFTATTDTMEIGVEFDATEEFSFQYATIDGFTLIETNEASSGKAIVENEKANGKYTMLYTALIADEAGEHILKLSFANVNEKTVDARIIVNGKGYAAAALHKTADGKYISADCVYIPLLLEKGYNRVSLSFGGYEVEINEVSLVDAIYR